MLVTSMDIDESDEQESTVGSIASTWPNRRALASQTDRSRVNI
jgi:hypothetical protein